VDDGIDTAADLHPIQVEMSSRQQTNVELEPAASNDVITSSRQGGGACSVTSDGVDVKPELQDLSTDRSSVTAGHDDEGLDRERSAADRSAEVMLHVAGSRYFH
jgi:hypothetical protein